MDWIETYSLPMQYGKWDDCSLMISFGIKSKKEIVIGTTLSRYFSNN